MKVALIVCGRLENRYAIEFIEHYKQLGFDHIYIADNNRDNEEHFEDVLQQYIDDQFVTIYDYRYVKSGVQYAASIEIYKKISNDYDWVAFFDFDEFLTLVEDQSIKDYLSRDCFIDANQILINWKIYTDNDLVYDDGGGCLERFTTPLKQNKNCITDNNYYDNTLCKAIIKTHVDNINYFDCHICKNDLLDNSTYNNKGDKVINTVSTQPINYDLAYIKHFKTKTIDEWINNKLIRGTGDRNIYHFKNTYPFLSFFRYNKMTKEKHEYIKNYIKNNK